MPIVDDLTRPIRKVWTIRTPIFGMNLGLILLIIIVLYRINFMGFKDKWISRGLPKLPAIVGGN